MASVASRGMCMGRTHMTKLEWVKGHVAPIMEIKWSNINIIICVLSEPCVLFQNNCPT